MPEINARAYTEFMDEHERSPSLGEVLSRLIAETNAHLDGRNLRLYKAGRIHAPGHLNWIGDTVTTGPLCGIGTTAGPIGRIMPTYKPVDCHRCLVALGATGPQLPTQRQAELDGLAVLEQQETAQA